MALASQMSRLVHVVPSLLLEKAWKRVFLSLEFTNAINIDTAILVINISIIVLLLTDITNSNIKY